MSSGKAVDSTGARSPPKSQTVGTSALELDYPSPVEFYKVPRDHQQRRRQHHDHSDEDEDDEGVESPSSTFWDTIATLYFPIMLLWLRRSMFGTANLIRSVLLGQCLHLVLNYLSNGREETFWKESVAPVLQTLVGAQGKDPKAWPTPPALTVLVALTILAFIVHPDGLTWFVLRKLR